MPHKGRFNNIEFNEQFKRALKAMEDSRGNIFITGKAGTGKSTLLDYFRSVSRKKIVVLAPTGVAALNVRGQTIHSFFGFKPNVTLEKVKRLKGKRGRIFKELEAIVIDEISMVRADLLDCVEKFLRLNSGNPRCAFGGIQMIFIGDLYQLPPVVTGKEKEIFSRHYRSPYFFSAKTFEHFAMEFIELEKIYRQKDECFIGLLNAIRNNSITDQMLAALNERVGADCREMGGNGKLTVHLTTTNQMAGEINVSHLQKLNKEIFTCTAEVSGDFEPYSYPADPELRIAVSCQVMLLNNDSEGRWVNGTMGKVKEIEYDKGGNVTSIRVRLQNGITEDVLPFNWELFRYQFNDETLSIE